MDTWQQAAREIGGSFEKESFGRPAIRYSAGGWEMLLEQGRRTDSAGATLYDITVLTAPVVNSAGLEFTIYREGVVERVAKFLEMQGDVQTGDAAFDRRFICKGNDPKRLCEVFFDARLKSLMLAAPDFVFALSFLKPDKLDTALRGFTHLFLPAMALEMEAAIRDKLHCSCKGVRKDPGEIKGMFEIFEQMLWRLEQLGFASPASR